MYDFSLESIWNLNLSRTLFREEVELRFVWKWSRLQHSRHRISLSRISESTPAVVQENGLAVRKRLGLLPKAIAVSSLFIGMILPTCSQRAQWTKYNMKLGRERFFVLLPSPHDSNTGYDGESRISHLPSHNIAFRLMQLHKNISHRYDFSMLGETAASSF